jgi:hypothetical protein
MQDIERVTRESTLGVNASTGKLSEREYSFVTLGGATCANISMTIQMLQGCYSEAAVTLAPINGLYSIDWERFEHSPRQRYTLAQPESQFVGFLFPQAFPQEERSSGAGARTLEKALEWLLNRTTRGGFTRRSTRLSPPN